MNHLPTDLYRKIFREWIYPDVLREFWRRQHTQRFKLVMTELIDECFNGRPEVFDDYIVTHEGVFFQPKPGWLYWGSIIFIRVHPNVSSRLHAMDRNFSLDVAITKETQERVTKLRRQIKSASDPLWHAYLNAKRYYDVFMTFMARKQLILTFDKDDSFIIRTTKDTAKLKYINLVYSLEGLTGRVVEE